MFIKNPFLYLPKSIWRIVKIDQKGNLKLKELSAKPKIETLANLDDWQTTDKRLDELSPAYVDFLWIATQPPIPLSAELIIKIMNSDSKIIICEEARSSLEPILYQAGFQFLKRLITKNAKSLLVFQKDVIPCCGS